MRRLLLLTSGLFLLAFPATGAAATHARGIIYSGPITVRAYKMSLTALTKGAHHGAFVAITFTRGTRTDKQQHYYQFTRDVQVKLAPGGATGTIKAKLGPFGRIDMTFSAGGGGRTTPGCPGALLFEHEGALSGTFHFVSGSSYFKTIDRSSFRAATATGKKGFNCKPPVQNLPHGTQLDVSEQPISGGHALGILSDFNIGRDQKGHILESFLMLDSSRAAEGIVIDHAIDVGPIPPSDFTNAPDLSTAQAIAASQFMTGTITYRSTAQLSPTETTGGITGTITANFDVPGPRTLPTGTGLTTATLDVL
jgi:hypothetical protein